MKNALKFLSGLLLFVLLVSISAYLTSCSKSDGNKTVKVKCVTCQNGGICINDSCQCPPDFEGISCQIRATDKVVGVWIVSEKGSITIAKNYNVYIQRDVNGNSLLIPNFNGNTLITIRATMVIDSIFIPEQTMEGKIIIGKGKAFYKEVIGEYGLIHMAYKVTDIATSIVDDYGYDSQDETKVSVWNR